MLITDKENLLRFVVLTGMYIPQVDRSTIVSFINGYELGRNNEPGFTERLKALISEKYYIAGSSDGWSGQISRLSENISLGWISTFKRITLEILAEENDKEPLDFDILKKRIIQLLDRIQAGGSIWFNENWQEEWLSLYRADHDFLKRLWSDAEAGLLDSINNSVISGQIFLKGTFLPTEELLKLKQEFDRLPDVTLRLRSG